MITIVTFMWRGERDYRAEHVNTLRRAIARTLSAPHRFICVSDDAAGLAGNVQWVRTPPAVQSLGTIKTLEGSRFPSCYRRLWAWSSEAKALLGERLFVIDIDLVPIADFSHLFKRTEAFVGWRPLARWGNHDRLGGGMYLMDAGVHPEVFDRFIADPVGCQREARRAGYRGSDQAWISHCVGRTAAVWPDNVGVYSIRDLHNGVDPLPLDACLVQFNGPVKPWNSPLGWVREHWR